MTKPTFNGFDYSNLSLEEGKVIWKRRSGFIFNSNLVSAPMIAGPHWEGRKAILKDQSACALFIAPRSTEARKWVKDKTITSWMECFPKLSLKLAENIYHLSYPGKYQKLDLIIQAATDTFCHGAFKSFPSNRVEFKSWQTRWDHVIDSYVVGGYEETGRFVAAVLSII